MDFFALGTGNDRHEWAGFGIQGIFTGSGSCSREGEGLRTKTTTNRQFSPSSNTPNRYFKLNSLNKKIAIYVTIALHLLLQGNNKKGYRFREDTMFKITAIALLALSASTSVFAADAVQ